MKKAKFLIYAALAASTVAISSCSDNDVLSEPANEPEGKALIVNPTVEGSRIATTGSDDFKSFKLFGFQNPPATQSQSLFFNGTEGYVYNGAIGSAWTPTVAGAKWPANSDTNSSNFYAISIDGGSTLPSYTGVDLSNIQQGKFSYTAPLSGSDVDLTKQEDILVASSLNALQSDNDGVLNLPFTHAFAKLTMQIRFNSYEGGNATGDIKDNEHITIKSITLHNIKLNGIYDYTSGWTASDMGDIVVEFPSGLDFTAQHLSGATNLFQDMINEASSIMIVPQTFTKTWLTTDDSPKTVTEAAEAPYIEIQCWIWEENDTRTVLEEQGYSSTVINNVIENYNPAMLDPDDFDTDLGDGLTPGELMSFYTMPVATSDFGAESLYFPFKITEKYVADDTTDPVTYGYKYYPFVFEANKLYNIRLNVYNGVYKTGKIAIHGAAQV